MRRLISADMGRLDSANAAMLPGGGGNPTPREVDWTLDLLGNWTGTTFPAAPERKITGPLNGEPTDTTHTTDWSNRIRSLVQ